MALDAMSTYRPHLRGRVQVDDVEWSSLWLWIIAVAPVKWSGFRCGRCPVRDQHTFAPVSSQTAFRSMPAEAKVCAELDVAVGVIVVETETS